jgi:hypothetical protein
VRTWRLERIRALCAANGWPQPVALRADLSLVAYSPLLKGLYDGPAAEPRATPEWSRTPVTRQPAAWPWWTPSPPKPAASPARWYWPGCPAQRSPRALPLIGTTKAAATRA